MVFTGEQVNSLRELIEKWGDWQMPLPDQVGWSSSSKCICLLSLWLGHTWTGGGPGLALVLGR